MSAQRGQTVRDLLTAQRFTSPSTVYGHDATTTGTDASYALSVPGLPEGTYTVTASIPGDPSPAMQPLTVLARIQDVSTVNPWGMTLLSLAIALFGWRAGSPPGVTRSRRSPALSAP